MANTGQRKRLKAMVGVLKGITSIIKATVSTKRNSRLRIVVLRATAGNPSLPPTDKSIEAVLSFGYGSHHTACGCIDVLVDRLHSTKNAFVALKCLFTIHSVVTKGSPILKDQLSFDPSFGGKNFLNMSEFRDASDHETWELSSWVRWYAGAIEQNLMVSGFLGHNLCSSLSSQNNKNKQEIKDLQGFLSTDLLEELDVLVNFVEVISDSPDSLHLQKNDLVYETVKLVAEDYRLVQRKIFVQLGELDGRIMSLSYIELARFLGSLQRLENCKDNLSLLFVNRARNDALWELISEVKMKIEEKMKEMRETKRLIGPLC